MSVAMSPEDVKVTHAPYMHGATGGFSAQARQGSIIQSLAFPGVLLFYGPLDAQGMGRHGELTCLRIAGPHDCGKMTMLSLICDAVPPSSGAVYLSPHLILSCLWHLFTPSDA